MKYLNKISAVASQRFILTGNPSQSINMELRYLSSQQMWVMDIAYEDFEVHGIVVVNSPNLLRAFKNKIPFGIMVLSFNTDLDPLNIDDFALQNSAMYLLNQDDITAMEASY